jgi:hypothetical protein
VKDKDITLPEEKLCIDGKIHRYATDEDKLGAKAGAYQIWPDGKITMESPTVGLKIGGRGLLSHGNTTAKIIRHQ